MKVSVFINDSYVNDDSTSMIYLRIFLNGKYLKIPLDIYVNPEDFNKKSGKVIGGSKKNTQNHIISTALGAASDIILKYKVNKKSLTRELFVKEFRNPSVLVDFYKFMYEQIDLRRGELTDTSRKQHHTCLNKLKEFKKTLLIAEIDEEFIKGFENHLRNKLKNGINTTNNNMKVFRTYVNIALRNELMNKNPFLYYKPKKTDAEPESLTEAEKKELERLYLENYLTKTNQKVLRWFLFCCETGIRISDLRQVKHENIQSKNTLSFKPKKTENVNNKRIEVPLTEFAIKLIKDESPLRIKGPLFDCISDQKMNKYIKDVVEVVKINKSVSFHMARHTFATIFLKKCTKANGIIILQKLLGHSNISSTMIYSHIFEDDINKAMTEFQS